MSILSPSVKEALKIGEGLEFKYSYEAINHYLRHHDLFFSLENYSDQYEDFMKELEKYSLHDNVDITIENALENIEKFELENK